MNSPGSIAHWCLLFSAAATRQSWLIQFPTFRRCFDDRPVLPTKRSPATPIAAVGGITVDDIGATDQAGATIEDGGRHFISRLVYINLSAPV